MQIFLAVLLLLTAAACVDAIPEAELSEPGMPDPHGECGPVPERTFGLAVAFEDDKAIMFRKNYIEWHTHMAALEDYAACKSTEVKP